MRKIFSELLPFIGIIGFFGLIALSVYNDTQHEKLYDYAYYNVGNCEEVIADEYSRGLFSDRYIKTKSNRVLVFKQDNIVIGDSLCDYRYSKLYKQTGEREFLEDFSSKVGIKNKRYLYTKDN